MAGMEKLFLSLLPVTEMDGLDELKSFFFMDSHLEAELFISLDR